MEQKVVLITGAGRGMFPRLFSLNWTTCRLTVITHISGIGKGLTEHFLSQRNTTVVAGLRNTLGADAITLNQLAIAEGSSLILAHIDSTSSSDAKTAVSILQSKHQISHIDIAIANAGICDALPPLAEMDVADLIRHIDTNTYGVLRLFQATWTLLEKARAPKFVCISSSLGSISQCGGEAPYTGAYGVSKAAANYLVAKINAEYEKLIAFSIDPG